MKQSRKAAIEENEFWTALVEARASNQINIPKAADAAAAKHQTPPDHAGVDDDDDDDGGGGGAAADADAEEAEQEDSALANAARRPVGGASKKAEVVGPRFPEGTRVAVYWPLDEEWYTGTLGEFDASRNLHSITYDDDEQAWLDLRVEDIKLVEQQQQQQPAAASPATAVGTSVGAAGRGEEEDDDEAEEAITEEKQQESEGGADVSSTSAGLKSSQAPAAGEDAAIDGTIASDSEGGMLAAHLKVHAAHAAAQQASDVGSGEADDAASAAAGGDADADADAASRVGQEPPSSPSPAPGAPADCSEEPVATLARKVTPTTVTASTRELGGGDAEDAAAAQKTGRSWSVLGGLPEHDADLTKLNQKYSNDMSAAAALAATIAAYADDDDDDDDDSTTAAQLQKQKQDETLFEEQFELGDLDLDDEDGL